MTRLARPSRRVVLRGAGVCVALPFLESLLQREVRAQASQAPKRFLALFFPNGTDGWQDWQLGGSGTNYTMGTSHASLAAYKDDLLFIKNLNGQYGGAPDHSRGTAEFLTGANISNMTLARVAKSIDQLMVEQLMPNTALASLHLGPTPYAVPPADTGWSSGYNTAVSWVSDSVSNPAIEDPQVAFDQVYQNVSTPGDQGAADKRKVLKQSVLDYVTTQIGEIRPRLGQTDGAKLDEYLTSLRDVEQRLQAQPGGGGAVACGSTHTRPNSGLAFPEHTAAMLDIATLALECDVTRVITYQMDYGFGNKDFGFLLGTAGQKHHNITHSGGANVHQYHQQIIRWYMDRFADMIGKLKAASDGNGSLLDSTLVFLSSDTGDGWSHSHQNLPIILGGRAGGALDPGRLVDATGAQYPQLLLSLLQKMDVQAGSFAGASSPLSGV